MLNSKANGTNKKRRMNGSQMGIFEYATHVVVGFFSVAHCVAVVFRRLHCHHYTCLDMLLDLTFVCNVYVCVQMKRLQFQKRNKPLLLHT